MSNQSLLNDFDLNDDLLNQTYPSVVERYYTRKYRTGVKVNKEDMCFLIHTNRVCWIITLAPSHPIIRDGKAVAKVDFQITDETNRLDNKVSGKTKRGGQWLQPTSRLCHVTCSDGCQYTIYGGLNSKLVEVNERLVKQPELLASKFDCEGYLAIVLVKIQDYDKQMKSLLSPDQYNALLLERQLETESVVDDVPMENPST